MTRPGSTSNERSSTAVMSPNRFVMLLTEMAGEPIGPVARAIRSVFRPSMFACIRPSSACVVVRQR